MSGLLFPPPPADPVPAAPVPEAPAPVATNPPPFVSPLNLTDELRDKFYTECNLRIEELRREMGLTPTNDVIPMSWMWLRKNHESYYQGDLSWRLAFGGIFVHSNITLGSGLRHARYNAACCSDDLLGTSPFMAALAAKPSKEDLAKQVEDYIQTAIENSNVREALREAQKIALYRNECVVKTGYVSDTTPFIGEATVLVDNATGLPITSPEKGLFFYEGDDLIESPIVEGLQMLESDPSLQIVQNSQPGLVTIPASGEIPERTGRFQYFAELPQVLTKKEGVYCDPIDWRSFLCPLRVKSIHDADTVVHLYLETPTRLQRIYGGIDVSQQYFTYWNQPGQDKPKYEQGETDQPQTSIFQQIIVAEVYRRCDPDETGEDKEVFAVLDLTNGKCIYYNYLANHMAKRPFEVVPGVERVPGRWYGRGIYGMLDSHLFYEDVEASRSFFKNSQNATIQFAHRDAVEDWKNGNPPIVGDGQTNWIVPNWNADGKMGPPIWRENLASNFEPDQELLMMMKNSGDALIGSISTSSANEAGFDASKTATGSQLVQQGSDVLKRAMEGEQAVAIEAILEQVVDTIMEHLDKTKLMADPATGLLATVNRNEARNMKRDVRLLLTRSKSTQLLNTSSQIIDIGMKYWQLMQTNPAAAKAMRPAFIAQAKALESNDGDTMFPEITDEQIQAFQQSQQNQQTPQRPESLSINYKDAPGPIQRQMEAKAGLTPLTPEQEVQEQQQQNAMEVTKAAASATKAPVASSPAAQH